jgi:hypothetical protein
VKCPACYSGSAVSVYDNLRREVFWCKMCGSIFSLVNGKISSKCIPSAISMPLIKDLRDIFKDD